MTAGREYGFGRAGILQVDSIARVTLGQIRESEARRAGFSGRTELIDFLRAGSTKRLTSASSVYRVAFHYVGERGSSAVRSAPAKPLDEIEASLSRMDRLSRRGPWTIRTLKLIQKNPRTAASRLAARVDRETRAFKTDVRKLKKLGLTKSYEVGYDLTSQGRAVLKRSG